MGGIIWILPIQDYSCRRAIRHFFNSFNLRIYGQHQRDIDNFWDPVIFIWKRLFLYPCRHQKRLHRIIRQGLEPVFCTTVLQRKSKPWRRDDLDPRPFHPRPDIFFCVILIYIRDLVKTVQKKQQSWVPIRDAVCQVNNVVIVVISKFFF